MLIIKVVAVIEIVVGVYMGGVMGGLGAISLTFAALGTVSKRELESCSYA